VKNIFRIQSSHSYSRNLKSKIENPKRLGLSVIAFVLVAVVAVATAQQPKKITRIGYLSPGSQSSDSSRLEGFRQGLRELGYREGQNIVIDYRFADGKPDQLPELATDLVHLKVDVILTAGTIASCSAKNATKVIPIVMAFSGDPIATGLVASLARPIENITGLSQMSPELSAKRLELLKEVVPRISRVTVIWNPTDPVDKLAFEETETAARAFHIKVQSLEVRKSNDIDSAFVAAARERANALITFGSPLIVDHRTRIVELAAKSRLPAIYEGSEFTDSGGLMSYGASLPDLFRRAATYVDKILKGTKPADLPVEQPMKFEFIVNLKEAKQIGLTIPPNVLARADKVIR
jgi:putative ABC transport system substrate-binding protein